MGLEAELYFNSKRKPDEDSLQNMFYVKPGETVVFDNAGVIMVMCEVDKSDTETKINVLDTKYVSGLFYENELDEDGKCIDLNKEVTLREGQALSLLKATKKGSRETLLWFERDDELDQVFLPEDQELIRK